MTPLLRCAVCGAVVVDDALWPWRCPNATTTDRHHVLHRIPDAVQPAPIDDPNPFIRYDARLTWARSAEAMGVSSYERAALVRQVDAAVASLDGAGFMERPARRADALSEELGFSRRGGVWLQDITIDPSGSHKARHLLTIALHLLACEAAGLRSPADRPRLAISSCGNAALAAATLAAAIHWPLDVFVPPWADPAVTDRLSELDAHITTCPRRTEDPPGDPCVLRFREAVAAGAVPFSVQGPENALCLDGARTLAWDLVESMPEGFDRLYVQVGGGALATSLSFGLADSGVGARVHAVQAAGCAPLARAWERARGFGVSEAAQNWKACMWPWEAEPRSVATGILDDETYDWLAIVQAMDASGGGPVVVSEEQLVAAHEAVVTAGIDADPTGSAALAGVLATRSDLGADERVVVPVTGVRRAGAG